MPNTITETKRVQGLPRLPQDKGEPVFAEPWQAQAFALVVKLSEQGYFTWKEWTAALGDELNVTAKGLADSAALVARKEAWRDAYRSTPDGMPVKLPDK